MSWDIRKFKNYSVARKAVKEGGVDPQALVQAGIELKRIAPEFGDDVIEAMLKEGVVQAGTMKNFLANSEDALRTLKGQAGRQVQLLPRMDLARQTRIAAVTTGNKVLRFDQAGKRVVFECYFTVTSCVDDGIHRLNTSTFGARKFIGSPDDLTSIAFVFSNCAYCCPTIYC